MRLIVWSLIALPFLAMSSGAGVRAPQSGILVPRPDPCDTALAAHFIYAINRNAPKVFTQDTFDLKTASDWARVVRDSITCAKAIHVWVTDGGSAPDSLGVVVVGTSGYVLIRRGDMAGEWQMTHWFDAQWRSLKLGLGM